MEPKETLIELTLLNAKIKQQQIVLRYIRKVLIVLIGVIDKLEKELEKQDGTRDNSELDISLS